MPISKSTLIFFCVILITGILTIVTDLKAKKIYNNHLLIGAFLGLAALIYTGFWVHENVLFHLINGLTAFAIGLCCYHFDLWKGGDAKLYTLYAFLMPALEPGHTLISSALNLFACAFITGMIVLTPVFIKDLTSNSKNIFSSKNLKVPLNAIGLTVFSSWVIFPVYYFAIYYCARFMPSSIIFLAITYVLFYLIRIFLKKTIKNMSRVNYTILGSGIAFGFFMRLWLNPSSLSWPLWLLSLLRITLFSSLSSFIYLTQDRLKEYKDRIPFAPLLFSGCLLSYTPFLTWIIDLIRL